MSVVDKSECSLEQSKILNIQLFHSVQFEDYGMKFCQYFNVGSVPYSELTFHSGLAVTCLSAFSTRESVIEKPKQINVPEKERL